MSSTADAADSALGALTPPGSTPAAGPAARFDAGTVDGSYGAAAARLADSHRAADPGDSPLDRGAMAEAAAHLDRLTKPPGSLGRIEALVVQLAGIAKCSPPPVPSPATVVVFAGDHGVLAEGVTPWPAEVTAQMVLNFCAGGAAINVLARHAGAEVLVVDVGVASALPPDAEAAPALIVANVARGTANLAEGPAMTIAQCRRALDVGAAVAAHAVARGARCLVTGDMGIGNTTPSAALISAFTGLAPAEVTGRGTGIDDDMLARKIAVVTRAVDRAVHATAAPAGAPGAPPAAPSPGAPGAPPAAPSAPSPASALVVLSEVGGLEIAALAGFITGAAAARVPVVLDGVIALAAAVTASALAPAVLPFCIAGHRSVEPGASAAMAYLGLEPLLNLDLRLGEGTGGCLAVPIVQAAAKLLGEMATFDSAGVANKS